MSGDPSGWLKILVTVVLMATTGMATWLWKLDNRSFDYVTRMELQREIKSIEVNSNRGFDRMEVWMQRLADQILTLNKSINKKQDREARP